jgi:hypothetical protein
MIFFGTFSINDYLTIPLQGSNTSGSAADLDSGSYTINFYESNTAAADAPAAMTTPDTTFNTKLDSKTGLYYVKVQLSAANGFEAGKIYFARVTGSVDSQTPAALYMWRVVSDGQSIDETNSGVATLVSRLTAPRAGYLDYINTIYGKLPSTSYLAGSAATGGAVSLADASITSAKFDSSTAFPLVSSDTILRTATTIDGTATAVVALKKILAYCAGDISVSGNAYTYRNYDDADDEMTLTATSSTRTRS